MDVVNARVAIVAGAGGGLGRAVTVTLAAGGLTVVAVDRTEHALHELPDGVRAEVADTTDPDVATGLIDRIAGEVGPPDVLVNTIGTFRPADALAPRLLATPANRAALPPEALAHAVAPEAIAGVIAFLVSDAAVPVSGAIVPAYGF